MSSCFAASFLHPIRWVFNITFFSALCIFVRSFLNCHLLKNWNSSDLLNFNKLSGHVTCTFIGQNHRAHLMPLHFSLINSKSSPFKESPISVVTPLGYGTIRTITQAKWHSVLNKKKSVIWPSDWVLSPLHTIAIMIVECVARSDYEL